MKVLLMKLSMPFIVTFLALSFLAIVIIYLYVLPITQFIKEKTWI